MNVVSLMHLKDQEERLVKAFPNLNFTFYKHPNEARLEVLEEADILISYHDELNETFLDKCHKLKLIAWFATGINNLPLEYIRNRNIKLTNAKGVHATQIAEYIFAYILYDIKQFKESIDAQDNRLFDTKIKPDTIYNKTILFLGTGMIPQRTAEIAKAFNMKVIGINTNGHSVKNFDEVYSIDNRREVLNKADFVVNVLPETEETFHLLKQEDFITMNKDVHFINVGRGTVVDEEILIEALETGEIRYASIDVFEEEPLNRNSRLFDLKNITITPHITGKDMHNTERCTEILITNLNSYMNNVESKLLNEINMQTGY